MVGPSTKPLGWAVAGCGWVARDFVIPAILAARDCRLLAVHDVSPIALDGLPRTAANYDRLADMLAHPGVDAVYVATPNHLHEAITVACAQAGKHVLCEKPMAPTHIAAARMVEACEAAGVVYATAFDQRFHAAHRTLQRMVEEGALGTVTQARIHYACWVGADWAADNWRVDPARAGGGAVIDLAPHGLDLLSFILDDRITALTAMLQRRVHAYPVDDGGVLTARFASGALASLHVAYNCPERLPRRRLEIIGTEAMAQADDTMGQTRGGSLRLIDAATGTARAIALDDDRNPFEVQIEAFADRVLTGAPFPGTPERDLELVGLLEEALRNRPPTAFEHEEQAHAAEALRL